MSWPIRRFRVRTLLILVMLVAVFLGGSRMALRAYRAKMYRRQAQAAAENRDEHLRFAEISRSTGDGVRAPKRERLAAYAEEWRRVLEHAASSGEMVYGSSGPPPPP